MKLQALREGVARVGRDKNVVWIDAPAPFVYACSATGEHEKVDASANVQPRVVRLGIRGKAPYEGVFKVAVTFYNTIIRGNEESPVVPVDIPEPMARGDGGIHCGCVGHDPNREASWRRDITIDFLSSITHGLLGDNGEVPDRISSRVQDLDDAVALCVTLLRPDAYSRILGPGAPLPPLLLQKSLAHTSKHQALISRCIREYQPLQRHPELFVAAPCLDSWHSSWFAPSFVKAYNSEDWSNIFTEVIPGALYTFDLFSKKFCDMLVDELDSYNNSGLPVLRPNSMNNYGVILNMIGMESMVDLLTSTFLREVSRRLFPKLGSDCDSHHTFNVRYRPDEDRGLDMHTDDSDVTFNVCLGKEFEGAGLQFCGTMKKARHRKASAQVRHALGRCLVHLGQLRHGADDIIAGERQNLIIWMRNSQWRKTEEYEAGAFETEAEPPDPVCLSYTHDRDYGQYKPFNDKTKAFKGTGWCPPDRYAYKGFVPDKPE